MAKENDINYVIHFLEKKEKEILSFSNTPTQLSYSAISLPDFDLTVSISVPVFNLTVSIFVTVHWSII